MGLSGVALLRSSPPWALPPMHLRSAGWLFVDTPAFRWRPTTASVWWVALPVVAVSWAWAWAEAQRPSLQQPTATTPHPSNHTPEQQHHYHHLLLLLHLLLLHLLLHHFLHLFHLLPGGPGGGHKGSLQRAVTARTADRKTGQNVRRHDLDRSYASMIKQKKKKKPLPPPPTILLTIRPTTTRLRFLAGLLVLRLRLKKGNSVVDWLQRPGRGGPSMLR